MKYKLKKLGTDDTAQLRELTNLFGETFEDTNNYSGKAPDDKYLTSFLNNDANIVLVATVDEKVVGGLVAYTLTKFEMERKEIYIYDLAVSNDHQRQGIGQALMKETQSVARDIGAHVVFVQADETDDAIKFYESLNPDENIRTRNFDYLV